MSYEQQIEWSWFYETVDSEEKIKWNTRLNIGDLNCKMEEERNSR